MNLVLIHGALGAASQLDPLRRRLERDFATHLVELEGHGDTPMSSAEYSIPGFVGGVARAMDDANVREAAIFGYRMGVGARPFVDAELPGRIARPVRLMVGDRDALVSVEETTAAATQAPKGELMVLTNTPHPIEQIDVEMVSGMVRGFLAGLSPE